MPRKSLTSQIGRSWLASAKIARHAGQWQTAYSAMLQAQHSNSLFSFMESAKLVKTMGEPLRALQELEKSMRLFGLIDDKPNVIDLTNDDEEAKMMKAKVCIYLCPTSSSLNTGFKGPSTPSTMDERVGPIRDQSNFASVSECNWFVPKVSCRIIIRRMPMLMIIFQMGERTLSPRPIS
jgi:hypothetical protein